jgi:uncharacterized protein (TIGR00730 family)
MPLSRHRGAPYIGGVMAKISSILVYCGSNEGSNPAHREAAAQLGRLLAEAGIRLVYGGGAIGLMGVLARATMEAGGEAVGVIPRFLDAAEKGLRSLSRLEVVDSMHQRKERMFALADAVIVLPGGLGTLDEAFEVLTWRQLGLHDKPIVFVDIAGYWQPLFDLVAHAAEEGFAPQGVRRLYRRATSVEAALEALEDAPEPARPAVLPERL